MQNQDPKDIGKTKKPIQVDPHSPYLKDMDQRNWSEMSRKYQQGLLAEKKLAAQVAKLAHEVPSLRPHLVPLLKQAHEAHVEALDAQRLASACFPKITAERWDSLTGIEKLAVLRRVAHKPMLLSRGLTKDAVRQGLGFMVYKVDREANSSKFYEGLVVPDDGGFRVIRRWGALTDSGQTGRVDGAKFDSDPRFWFPSEALAMRELNSHFATRVSHGYVDAFGPKHQTPDGHKLPMGEYPVGLARQVGFGWGTQSVTTCIPSLRGVQDAIQQAQLEIQHTGRSDKIKDDLDRAIMALKTVAHADSTMAQKILGYFSKSYRRLSGSPRFLPDPEGKALSAELSTAQRYITKQLSLCN